MCRNLERLKTMFRQILWYKFLFVKVIHFWGRRDSIFNLNNVWHHSNISKSLENFILVMFYANVAIFKKNVFIFKDRTLQKKIISKGRGFRGGSDEKMRRMWFGLEIDVVGLPPLVQLNFREKYFECFDKNRFSFCPGESYFVKFFQWHLLHLLDCIVFSGFSENTVYRYTGWQFVGLPV